MKSITLQVQLLSVSITAPPVPESGRALMPDRAESFSEGLLQIAADALESFRPDLSEAYSICCGVIAIVLLISLVSNLHSVPGKAVDFTGAVSISALLLGSTNSLIHLAAETVGELSEYGKLLLPVMTSALAAQGGVTTSAALYAGTAVFSTILSSLISGLLVPLIYLFIAISAANCALQEEILKKLADLAKWFMVWSLKIILYVFTGYIGITGVVSGTTDAAALKAAKLTISGFVPVVGGILSDASEAVLVSAGVVKNAAGIYGILAIAAVCIGPCLRILGHYLLLKATGAVCTLFASRQCSQLIGNFTSAMGVLLAITCSMGLMHLISTVCFLKGVS